MNDGVEVSVNKRGGSGGKAEETMIVVRWFFFGNNARMSGDNDTIRDGSYGHLL